MKRKVKEADWKKLKRSLVEITDEDLIHLTKLAEQDFDELTIRYPKYEQLREHKIAVCLCQGAALHYIDHTTGVRDFDIYTFFDKAAPIRWPFRRRAVKDFGSNKFGKTLCKPGSRESYNKFKGRKVDILGRQIPYNGDYQDSIQEWLRTNNAPTPYHLSQKAVVVLWPPKDRGDVVWPLHE